MPFIWLLLLSLYMPAVYAQPETTFTVKKKPAPAYFKGVFFSARYHYLDKFTDQETDSAGNHFFAPLYYSSSKVIKADSVYDVFVFTPTGQVKYLYTTDGPETFTGNDLLRLDTLSAMAVGNYAVKNDTITFVFNVLPRVKNAQTGNGCNVVGFTIIGAPKSGMLSVIEESTCTVPRQKRCYPIYIAENTGTRVTYK